MRNFSQNLKLKSKILFVIIAIIILLIAAFFCSLLAIMHSENHLLFEAVSGSLNYSAEDINNKLSNIEYMSSSIVSNSVIRKNLITLENEHAQNNEFSNIRIENAKSTISASLSDFYQTYKNTDICFINLYYGDDVISSYNTNSSYIPEKNVDLILNYSQHNSGYPYWITDYCASTGMLYLARDCRQVENLKFHTLGTVVVGINMKHLIENSTASVLYDNPVQYALFQSKQLFYHTDGINPQQIKRIDTDLKTNYDIISADQDRFFSIRGQLKDNEWNFICLIPYDSISKTISLTLQIVFVFILIVVLIAYLISHYFTRSISNDFTELVDKMNAFGQDETQIPISSDYSNRNDEIGILHRQFDKMAHKIQHLIQQNYLNELLAKDAKLKALESQINPHFLYNTLETVNWRAKAIGEQNISSMVESLGMLLRETLNSSTEHPTLSHELEIVKNYLTIQKIRYEERLEYNESIDSALLTIRLPHLTLQPLIENAIHYAIEENTENCSIQINGYISEDKSTIIDVINSNSQFPPNTLNDLEEHLIEPHGLGIGLLNIHKRLQLVYGADYGLILFNLNEDHAVARIKLPGGNPIC